MRLWCTCRPAVATTPTPLPVIRNFIQSSRIPASVFLCHGAKGFKLSYQLLLGLCRSYDSDTWLAIPQAAVSDQMPAKGTKIQVVPIQAVGRDSSVGIATRYGLGGRGIESRWWRDFPHPSRPALGPTSYRMGNGSFPGVKRPGRGVDHPPHLPPS